jgi:epoxyqueuosine reductase
LTINDRIKSKALEQGFSYCGFAKAGPLEQEAEWLKSYLERKPAGLFEYLSGTQAKRLDPRNVLEDAKTIIVVLLNYYAPPLQEEENGFIIARYALGKDYHFVIKEKLGKLVEVIKSGSDQIRAKAFVDSGPVLEKAWAQRSGAGWIGKNTLLINKSAGSFFFIGIILTNLEIEPDEPEEDHCGTCRKCIDACPTGALEMPWQLNPGKCISYWTIESKTDIPEELIDNFHNRIFGCDICQDACPYNKFAKTNDEPAFRISDRLRSLQTEDWLKMTEAEFHEIFKDTPVIRTGYDKMMRTIKKLY